MMMFMMIMMMVMMIMIMVMMYALYFISALFAKRSLFVQVQKMLESYSFKLDMRRHIMSLFSENAKLKGGGPVPWMGSCWVQMMVMLWWWCDGDDCMVKIWWLWWDGSDMMVMMMMMMVDGSDGWYCDRQVGSSSRCSCYSCVIMAMMIMIMYIWW